MKENHWETSEQTMQEHPMSPCVVHFTVKMSEINIVNKLDVKTIGIYH